MHYQITYFYVVILRGAVYICRLQAAALMKKVSLQFMSKHELIEFLGLTLSFRCVIDLEKLTITSQLSEADIELAVNGFRAKLIEENPSRKK